MAAFKGMNPGEGLDNFHQRCVVPTPQETSSRNAEIDAFVRFLQNEFGERPYTVARVLKSGSLGKGTAVRGSADIDLVVIMNGLRTISDLKEQRKQLLDKMDKLVKGYGPWKGQVQLSDRTNYSLCYLLNGQEVDILPALDIGAGMYGGKDGVYAAMHSYPDGKIRACQEFSASLAPLQIDFVKPQREAVKRVIRLLKFWKKEKHVDIRSYTLELLTIHTDQNYAWRHTEDLFRKVLMRLEDCQSIDVMFNNNYKSGSYVSSHKKPYVVDPANPYMNTMHGIDCNEVSQAARQMLRSL